MNHKFEKVDQLQKKEDRKDKTLTDSEKVYTWKDLGILTIKTFRDATVSTVADIYSGIVRLFRGDPVETLHAALPAVHSEINFRTLSRFLVYLCALITAGGFIKILREDIWVEFPEEIEEYGKGPFCPALGNMDRCERNYYSAVEGFWFLVALIFIHYFSCIQGSKLTRKTFFKINAFQTILSVMQGVRWRTIDIDLNWGFMETGAWRLANDNDPVVLVQGRASITFLAISVVSFLNYCDTIKKLEEQRTWDSDLE